MEVSIMKRKGYSPLLAGIGASFLLIGFYWIVLVGFESVDYAINQWNTYKYWMIPLVAGFGLQMSLVVYVTRAKGKVKNHMGRTGFSSALSMVICCLHHVVDFIPILGFTAAATFLTQYQTQFLGLGILMNFLGIMKMLKMIKRHHIYDENSWLKILESFNILTMRRGVAIISSILIIGSVFMMGTDFVEPEESDLLTIKSEETLSYSSNQVTYDFTLNSEDDNDEFWVFDIAINTHSVDLSQINLAEHLVFNGAVTLEGSSGGLEYVREGSGHHVADYIYIPKMMDGQSTINATTSQVSLEFHDEETDVVNVLTWDIG